MHDYDTHHIRRVLSMTLIPAVQERPMNDEASNFAFNERPSKTRLKQASHELQELGEAVVALPEDRLAGLAISEALLDAVLQYKKTRTHEGKRRQMQYIGKLM